jgi:hypothetical protein
MQQQIMIPVSPGELWDKISILQIKATRISDSTRHSNVAKELELLQDVARRTMAQRSDLRECIERLSDINESLWGVEDDLRQCERGKDFGAVFIELARSVYRLNDERAAIKRRINEMLGAEIFEEKQYLEYE